MRFVNPVVGQWYLSRGTDRMFEVVSVDDGNGAVEIQDFDGSLDEIVSQDWLALDVEPIEPPEDLTGAYDFDDADTTEDQDYQGGYNETRDLRAEWQGEPAPRDW